MRSVLSANLVALLTLPLIACSGSGDSSISPSMPLRIDANNASAVATELYDLPDMGQLPDYFEWFVDNAKAHVQGEAANQLFTEPLQASSSAKECSHGGSIIVSETDENLVVVYDSCKEVYFSPFEEDDGWKGGTTSGKITVSGNPLSDYSEGYALQIDLQTMYEDSDGNYYSEAFEGSLVYGFSDYQDRRMVIPQMTFIDSGRIWGTNYSYEAVFQNLDFTEKADGYDFSGTFGSSGTLGLGGSVNFAISQTGRGGPPDPYVGRIEALGAANTSLILDYSDVGEVRVTLNGGSPVAYSWGEFHSWIDGKPVYTLYLNPITKRPSLLYPQPRDESLPVSF